MIIDTTQTKIERKMTRLTQEQIEDIITQALQTDEGRMALSRAMVEPRRCGGLEYNTVCQSRSFKKAFIVPVDQSLWTKDTRQCMMEADVVITEYGLVIKSRYTKVPL